MIGRTICAYLLWLPPLGWLGLHQCYLGRHYHAVWIATTFGGFIVGWFRDLWKIPTYAAGSEEGNYTGGCCCGICARLKKCICNCFGRKGGKTLDKDAPEREDDLSDTDENDVASASEVATAETSPGPEAMVKKLTEQLAVVQLKKEFEKYDTNVPEDTELVQISQVQLKAKVEEFTRHSLSSDSVMKLVEKEPIDEMEVKDKLELMVTFSLTEECMTIVKGIKRIRETPSARDSVCSDNEEDDGEVSNKVKKRKRKQAIYSDSLGIMNNFERVFAAFITARYYRSLVATAVSEYLEIGGWIADYLLKLLPLIGMMCGVYLVSNIGRPPRLTIRVLFISGLIAEALFGVIAEVLYGTSIQIVACLVCTVLACWWWERPKSDKQSSKYSCFAVTSCACVAMTLVWGSIVLHTTIEVDGSDITVSEALQNFYNSPAWPQMKEALWDMLALYLEGNWDEASETLLRMSDLSGAERALSVLGLPRDADEATIKAQYKKLAREWHPDKYQGEDREGATNKFIEIQQAYTLLTKRIRS